VSRLPPGVRRLLRIDRELGRQVPDDVDAEIRFHLESRVDELLAEGVDRAAAERRALEEFGDLEGARRTLGRETARTERRRRRLEWLHEFRDDVRYGWRKLRSRPGFAAVAILTLALGIGATTAMFSVVYAVLLRPLPYPHPDRLVQMWDVNPGGADHNVVASGDYLAWRDQASSFEAVGAYGWAFSPSMVDRDGRPSRVSSVTVTPSVFRILGTRPEVGRMFTHQEGERGAAAAVLLSHSVWRTRFGGDSSVVGRTLKLDDEPYTVVGVLPRGFDFPRPDVQVYVARRFGAEDTKVHRSHQWHVISRLGRGVSLGQARSEVEGIQARLGKQYPEAMQGWGVNLVPFRSDLVASVRPLLLALFGMVVLVLLITCANLANLLLARALSREREVALRAALGAGRGRLLRQLLTESLVVAVLGGGLGVVAVRSGLAALVSLAPSNIPLLGHTRVDPGVLAFSAATTLAVTLLIGLVPALRVTGSRRRHALRSGRDGSSDPRHGRLRAGLLIAEVALAVVLLVGTGLLVRSFERLQGVDPGFESHHALTAMLDLPRSRYPSTKEQAEFYSRLLRRVRGLPGVVSAAGTAEPPVIGYDNTFSFAIQGRPGNRADGMQADAPLRAITPGYFRTMRIPVRRGRAIDERDVAGSERVAVINESMARRSWGTRDPIGDRISFGGATGPDWWRIVGVVGDVKNLGADQPAQPAVYIPQVQKRWDWMSWLTIVARTDRAPATLGDPLRQALWGIDDRLSIVRLTTMDEVYAGSNARRRFAALLVGGFGALAVLLGLTGVYGVLSYSVGERRREFGVRMALGADGRSIAGSVLGSGLRLAVAGILVGLLAALVLGRFLKSLLFEVSAADPVTFAAVPLLVVVVAGLASWLPARRATRVDPAEVLRVE
jgi:putative ABC transport system permease protein